MTVRTRFAPSPTGYLHIGGVRTALFSYLYTRKHGGQFILRIEDTDRERSTDESIQAILDGMEWLGLDCDEGPFYQTKRFDRYDEVLKQLLDEGKAYRCYCTKERLQELREQQTANKQKPRYDGHCRNCETKQDAPHVIRFKNPIDGAVSFNDLVHGTTTFQNEELDDLIIARTDGTPTYNFTVVVDDFDMEITHVIRGDDHINNTPRQINILNALGAKTPVYMHVPMILGPDGKRLSKRHGAVSVLQYKEDGYLPEALLNYLVRLGWSHGDQEIFSRDEMIALFDGSHLNKSPAAFNTEKALWLNQHYLKSEKPEVVAKSLEPLMKDCDLTQGPPLTEIVKIQAERCKDLKEMAEKSIYFYNDVNKYDEKAARKNLTSDSKPILEAAVKQFDALQTWQAEPAHQVIHALAEQFDLKLGKIAQPMRVALTGGTVSPPMDLTLELIGKERVLTRLNKAIEHINGL